MSDAAGAVNRCGGYTRSGMDEIKITGEPSSGGDRCAFLVDRPLLPADSAHFGPAVPARHSPLAAELLAIPGIESVLVADNTVTVTAAHAGRLAGAGHREHHSPAHPERGPDRRPGVLRLPPVRGGPQVGDPRPPRPGDQPGRRPARWLRRAHRRQEEQRVSPPRRGLPGMRRGRRHAEAGHRKSDPQPRPDRGRDPRYHRPRRRPQSRTTPQQNDSLRVESSALSVLRRTPTARPSTLDAQPSTILNSSLACAARSAASALAGSAAREKRKPR